MFKAPLNLATARILLSNDDGVHAAGLKALERVIGKISKDVWTVAPEAEQSGAGHSLTIHQPLRQRKLAKRRFAVDGTPTDCMLLAIHHILGGHRPDLVISGINHGGNLGEDVTYSGTIAAAMEATLLGIPAIALSQFRANDISSPWAIATHYLPGILKKLAKNPWPKDVLININFPDCPPGEVSGIHVVRQGRRRLGNDMIERIDSQGRPYYWLGNLRSDEPTYKASDLSAMKNKAISITPLNLDLTHRSALRSLAKAFP